MTLRQQIEMWKHRALVAEAKALSVRSSRWHTVKEKHLKIEPSCQFCGSDICLEVHHIKPVHLNRELELSSSNLITLCEVPGKLCHLRVGHLGCWKKINVRVREVCREAMPKRENQ